MRKTEQSEAALLERITKDINAEPAGRHLTKLLKRVPASRDTLNAEQARGWLGVSLADWRHYEQAGLLIEFYRADSGETVFKRSDLELLPSAGRVPC